MQKFLAGAALVAAAGIGFGLGTARTAVAVDEHAGHDMSAMTAPSVSVAFHIIPWVIPETHIETM